MTNTTVEKVKESRFAHFVDKLAVESEPGLTHAQLMLANHDLKPVEPERRQWRWLNFVAFWIADSFNINTWMIASSNIGYGLSWWQSWLTVWVGYAIAACFICMTVSMAIPRGLHSQFSADSVVVRVASARNTTLLFRSSVGAVLASGARSGLY